MENCSFLKLHLGENLENRQKSRRQNLGKVHTSTKISDQFQGGGGGGGGGVRQNPNN